MNKLKSLILAVTAILTGSAAWAYDGSCLWLSGADNDNQAVITVPKSKSPTVAIAAEELNKSWHGEPLRLEIKRDKHLGNEGFRVYRDKKGLVLSANNDLGLLYGSYALLRDNAAGKAIALREETPAYNVRVLNHWDNLDGTIERGYSGHSIWNWDELPDVVSPRYREYARANASVGINGVVLNNVNASSKILSAEYLAKVAKIADVFRPYGIKVYLSANFAAPMQLGGLKTADPLEPEVAAWWKAKADEIYKLIPDFGGFLVKANSEGQPGPCDFDRTHAEGANMMARALKPHGGIVMWRAFVYSPADADRAKQAYIEFQPLDGKFDDNVIVQIKNGPIDFQPREPYSPLFGAMPQTDQMVEFQVTQEYLGHSNHIAYLAPMWTEFFDYVSPSSLKAIAGVANVGNDTNWTGHPMAQANWYAFGRLAWNPQLSSEEIIDEWMPMTLNYPENTPKEVTDGLKKMMLDSREAVVDYMMPLGLHHLFAFGHHYGPEPWCDIKGGRPDWMPPYYHRADSAGLGFNRSSSGSNAVAQYPAQLAKKLDDINTCPEEFILWFHHVPWDFKMKSGATLWQELCNRYQSGVESVETMQRQWTAAKPYIDPELWNDVNERLMTQARDANWWREGCLLYFQQFSGMPIPDNVTPPVHTLDQLKGIKLGISNYECPTPELLNSKR
ncbi:alpha-glucuronidase [Muribaculum sp. NM65_B17]|uniref:alpha-glucuronidase n=1 Tax=Muribaculum sp. NM65_B17 TaxID=2516961 RepID=UPI0010940F09|nr:alpha-glucuronidase [Muribaculum sp. NM65_B17]TGY05682.1 alpha-glucuronidase [Muribaculum sp. NM65_B17]THG43798.1 alpha-glucuronidase [Muribaculaceae bacterium]